MKWISLVLVMIVLCPAVFAQGDELDAFYASRVIDRIDTIPQDTLKLCKAEVDAGVAYYEERAKDILGSVPLLSSIYVFFAVILGVFLGQSISLLLHKHTRLRLLRTNTEILNQLKEMRGVINERSRKSK